MPDLLPSSFKGSTESLAELPIKIQSPPLLPKVPTLKVTAHNREERWALDHSPCGRKESDTAWQRNSTSSLIEPDHPVEPQNLGAWAGEDQLGVSGQAKPVSLGGAGARRGQHSRAGRAPHTGADHVPRHLLPWLAGMPLRAASLHCPSV